MNAKCDLVEPGPWTITRWPGNRSTASVRSEHDSVARAPLTVEEVQVDEQHVVALGREDEQGEPAEELGERDHCVDGSESTHGGSTVVRWAAETYCVSAPGERSVLNGTDENVSDEAKYTGTARNVGRARWILLYDRRRHHRSPPASTVRHYLPPDNRHARRATADVARITPRLGARRVVTTCTAVSVGRASPPYSSRTAPF